MDEPPRESCIDSPVGPIHSPIDSPGDLSGDSSGNTSGDSSGDLSGNSSCDSPGDLFGGSFVNISMGSFMAIFIDVFIGASQAMGKYMQHRSFFFILGTAVMTAMFLVPAYTAKAARLYINTNPLFEACLQRCEEQTPLGELTKRGCYKGCAEIRRSFNISESYRSMASCIEDMNDLELEKDLVIEKYQAWCDEQWPHLHKRKGCKDAVEVYIRAATVNSICYNQSPKAIAKQTPRTTMTTRYPAVTTHSAGHPAPMPATMPPHAPTGSFQDNARAGGVLSMPPVYDTPKYSYPAAGTKQRVKPAPKRTTPSASHSAGKAPALAPPKQAGATASPKSGSAPATAASGTTAQSQNAKPVPVLTPSTAVAPVRSVPQAAGTVSAPSTQSPEQVTGQTAGQTFGQPSSQPSVPPLNATAPNTPPPASSMTPTPPPIQDAADSPAPAPLPAPTPVINAATTPTAPPVIAPPAPIMSDFTAAPSPPAAAQTPPRVTTQPLGQTPNQAPNQTPGLLPPLQQPNAQQSGSQQMGQQQTHGIDTPMPAPIPAPTT